jgi:hypothetical protein
MPYANNNSVKVYYEVESEGPPVVMLHGATEHLDFAIKKFREMKIQPSLERTLRHKEILKAYLW